jgi:molecular chaperone GrpE
MERDEDINTVTVEPEAGLDQLKSDLQREHEMHLRTLADFDNYRRRVERDRANRAASGKRDILVNLLEVLDGFDRALPHLSATPSSVTEGIQAIHRRLLDLLEKQSVTAVKSVGEPFDPTLHEAIGAVESDEYPSGTVVEEVQRGYRMGDELLRPARVRVVR